MREVIHEIVTAWLDEAEAMAGRGHDGPHDAELARLQGVRKDDPSACLACAGAQYGTGIMLQEAIVKAASEAEIDLTNAPIWFRAQVQQASVGAADPE